MTTFQCARIRASNGCAEVLGAYLREAFADVESAPGCDAFAIEPDQQFAGAWLITASWQSPEALQAFISGEQLASVLSCALQRGWIQAIDCNAAKSRVAA